MLLLSLLPAKFTRFPASRLAVKSFALVHLACCKVNFCTLEDRTALTRRELLALGYAASCLANKLTVCQLSFHSNLYEKSLKTLQ